MTLRVNRQSRHYGQRSQECWEAHGWGLYGQNFLSIRLNLWDFAENPSVTHLLWSNALMVLCSVIYWVHYRGLWRASIHIEKYHPMRHSRWQILIPVAIAATTTLFTTSFTSFLLTRPWCIEFESENVHRLLYGLENCGTQKSNTHPRMTRKQTRSSVIRSMPSYSD